MNINISKKYIFSLIVLIIISCAFLMNLLYLNDANTMNLIIALVLNLLLVMVSFLTLGIEIITFSLFCIILLTIPITIQYFTGESYGLLSLGLVQLHYADFLKYTFLYWVVFLIMSIIFKISDDEYKLVFVPNFKFNSLNIVFNNLMAIVFTIVAFPRLTLSVSTNARFNMLLPGHAWNQLAIVSLLFNLSVLRKNNSVKLTYLFVILWFLLNGERADITGLILGIFVYECMIHKKYINSIKISHKIFYIGILLAFIIFLNDLASVRSGGKFSLKNGINSILVTPTISDVSYIFNTVIDYSKLNSTLNGKLFFSNLLSIIPFNSNNVFSNIISNAYPYPGGEPWLAQPLLDLHTWGLIVFGIVDFIFFKLLVIKKNLFFKMEYIALLCLIPRAIWYGRGFVFSTMFFFVPFMFIMNRFITRIKMG